MLLLLAEVVCVALVAVGAGLAYLPAGLIVAGLLGILACEAYARRPKPLQVRSADGDGS